MNATRDQIEEYLHGLALQQHPDDVLDAMEAYAAEHSIPLIGRAAGAFIELAARSIGARRVLELGAGIGYGTLWLARAVGSDGEVSSIEPDLSKAETARQFLNGWADIVKIKSGDVIDAISRTEGEFDVVYCDARKDLYPKAWTAAASRIRLGGLWLSDNALWHGGAVTGEDVTPATTGFAAAVREHNELVVSDSRFVSALVPIRDGVLAALRVS
jgi:predicted O-methyltransferase YrrM